MEIIKRSLLIALAGMLLAGCSKKTYSCKSSDPIPSSEYILSRPITHSEELKGAVGEDVQREIDLIRSEIADRQKEYPKISFPSKETEHVSITSYDPFTESKEIVINLEELKKEYYFPYKGKLLSTYGMRGGSMHTGIDIKAISNDTIKSFLPGVVRMSKNYSGYGNIVVVRHYNGLESVYSHNSKNLVKVNDVVHAGTPLALAGRTGRATTEHLHFELRVMGEHFDPALVIDPVNHTLMDGIVTITRKSGKIVASSTTRTPSTKSSTTLASATPSSASKTATANTSTGNSQTHRISKGDTLYSLSKRYNTSVSQLCSLNGITANTVLRIGDVIRVK